MRGLPQALRVALDHVHDAVVITTADDETRVIYTNAFFTHASSYSATEVIGQSLTLLQQPRALPGNAELTAVRRKDGTEYVVRRQRTPLLDDDSEGLVVEVQRADTTHDRLIAERSKDII